MEEQKEMSREEMEREAIQLIRQLPDEKILRIVNDILNEGESNLL